MKNTNKKVESEYVTKSDLKEELGLLKGDLGEMIGGFVNEIKTEINGLAEMTKKGFDEVHEKIDKVNARVDSIDSRLSNVESDMEKVATKSDLLNLQDRFVSQYNFDLLKARVSILEDNPDNA
jgi:methyl-accepting chemotaxis protein